MKKLLSLVLTIALIICAVPFGAFTFTANAEISGYYAYEVENDEAIITFVDHFSFPGGDVIIPSTMGGYPVTSIADGVFSSRANLTSISIPDSVTSLGQSLFYDCTNLTQVSIGSGVTNIDAHIFSGCTSLQNINVSKDNQYYSDIDGVVFNKVSTTLVCYPAGRAESDYTIPYTVINIGEEAFSKCDNLKSVTLPSGVIDIGDCAFQNCINLESVNIPNRVTSIGRYAFSSCNIKNIVIPSSVTNIGSRAFSNCGSLVSINIPDNVTGLGEAVFAESDSLVNATIGTGVTEIKYKTFYGCKNLINVELSGNVSVIGSEAFSYCENLTNMVIPKGVTEIAEKAFNYCTKLANLHLSNGVKKIKFDAFYKCDGLTDVWFTGTERNKNSITIGLNNWDLTDAQWHYNVCEYSNHKYDGCEDADCNLCEWTKLSAGHVYSNACDKKCNLCEIERVIRHTFDDIDDEACNVCGQLRKQVLGITITEKTGVYKIAPSNSTGNFYASDITVYDSQENEVKYNFDYNGFPLVKGQTYYTKECTNIAPAGWVTTLITEKVFADTQTEENGGWYNDAVTYSVGAGLITGYGGTNLFGTADRIQRQDFVVILARLAGVDLTNYQSSRSSFADVPRGAYYEKAIMWAADCGITTGYGDGSGRFGVGDNITREQLVTFLYRYAKYINGGVAPSVSANAEQKAKVYADYSGVTSYAKEAIIWALDKGVITGQGGTHIAPGGNALRCEVAKIFYNIFLNDTF